MNEPTGNRKKKYSLLGWKLQDQRERMDKNLAEPDTAKKRITDNKEFFNYINRSDSKKQDLWWLNVRDEMKAAPNIG